MWNIPSITRLSKIPRLGETDKIETLEKKIFLHFFMGGSDWYVAEFDGEDTFFGYVILNSDTDNAEWGYFPFLELQHLKKGFLEVDCERATYFKPRKVKDIPGITKTL